MCLNLFFDSLSPFVSVFACITPSYCCSCFVPKYGFAFHFCLYHLYHNQRYEKHRLRESEKHTKKTYSTHTEKRILNAERQCIACVRAMLSMAVAFRRPHRVQFFFSLCVFPFYYCHRRCCCPTAVVQYIGIVCVCVIRA